MQSSTGQYSTHAGEPAQPVQHWVITASSFGFFLGGAVIPLERGSCFNASGTIPGTRVVSDWAGMFGLSPRFQGFGTTRAEVEQQFFSSPLVSPIVCPA